MIIKSSQELEYLQAGGKILAHVLQVVSKQAKVGVTTRQLEKIAQAEIKKFGATPSFQNYQGYPAALCTSVNQQIVHGIPTDYALRSGDILGIDCGVWYKGFCTDMALTVGVGEVSAENKKLIKTTSESLTQGLTQIKSGNRIGDYAAAVQKYVERQGFSVIRGLVGHGVGKQVHEEPRVPNFGKPHTGVVLTEGLVLALEPMVAVGSYELEILADGWTIIMSDGSMSAHFELTIVVTKNGYELITPIIW
jgi:methionyl aminopeptidase